MSVLDEILEGVRADLAERQSRVSLEQLKDQARKAPSPLDAVAVLAGALIVFLAGVLTALHGPDWPVMSTRYDAPTGHGAREAGAGPRGPALDAATMWESLNGGEDPTDDPVSDPAPGRPGDDQGAGRPGVARDAGAR